MPYTLFENGYSPMQLDEIGYWSEVKLDIIREYAEAYSKLLSARKQPSFDHVYVDGFAGPGVHISKATGEYIKGSPINALLVKPAFKAYHLIDLNGDKTDALRQVCAGYSNVHIYQGDCNDILLQQVFPEIQYAQYKRGLCLLDPYGLHLKWEVIAAAGQSKALDIFLNFPLADMNRNVLWNNPQSVDEDQEVRMNTFWGDDTWKQEIYSKDLFQHPIKNGNANEVIAESFRKRLIKHAGFQFVPQPLPMRNSRGAIVYYLFFASQKPVAEKIVNSIFEKYKDVGKSHVN